MARIQGVQIKKRDENGECVGAARLVKPSDPDKAIVQAINAHYFAATASRNVDGTINKAQTNQNRVIEKEDFYLDVTTGQLRCKRHTDKQLYQKNEDYLITPDGICNCKGFEHTGDCKHFYWAKIYFPDYFIVKKQFTVILSDTDISEI